MKKSNCLLGALFIRRHFGGELKWRKPRRGCPWGHFYVLLQSGHKLSYSAIDKNISSMSQLWFEGYIKRTKK